VARKFAAWYGSNPLHLLGAIAAWALAGYVVLLLGPHALWNHTVWWQSITVWFLAAIVAHDLVLFPLYALADRSFAGALAAMGNRWAGPPPRVSPLNYLRLPTLATGLSLLLFFPGIIQQGRFSYIASTGQNQQPFLGRWLALVAALYGVSAVAYAVRLATTSRRGQTTDIHVVADDDSGPQTR
jgi:hypothetical protein